MRNICVILEHGWIIIGEPGDCPYPDEDEMHLCNASVVRSWHNGKGIGGIAKKENKEEYTLDAIGNVLIRKGKIIFAIPCEW